MYYPEGMKVRVSLVHSIEPYRIFLFIQDLALFHNTENENKNIA